MRDGILHAVCQEVRRSDERYGPFTSSHEGLGVLTEEYTELIAAIRRNDPRAIEVEAIQVAAVSLRIVAALDLNAFRERSNLDPL